MYIPLGCLHFHSATTVQGLVLVSHFMILPSANTANRVSIMTRTTIIITLLTPPPPQPIPVVATTKITTTATTKTTTPTKITLKTAIPPPT